MPNAGKETLYQYIQGLLSDDTDVRPEQVAYVSREFEALQRKYAGGAKRRPVPPKKPAPKKPSPKKLVPKKTAKKAA